MSSMVESSTYARRKASGSEGSKWPFRSKLLFDDLLPAFLIVAPETSHAPFAFLPGGYP